MEQLEFKQFNELQSRAEELSHFSLATISYLIDSSYVKVTSDNFKCLSKLPQPIQLAIENAEVENEFIHNEVVNAVEAADLSMINKTSTIGGSRWSNEEKGFLKNFHKYTVKKNIDKPDYCDLHSWIEKRKTTKEALFGSRSVSAILAHYKKISKLGEFDIKKT